MNISNINQDQYEFILKLLDETSIEWTELVPRRNCKEDLRSFVKLQYDEQIKGGPWKARIREQGYVI